MYDGLHFVYEGKLANVQMDQRLFTMRLDYPDLPAPVCIQFSSGDVVSLLPRYGRPNASMLCTYFHAHGHCAFGLTCNRTHDPSRLCDRVKERLRSGDLTVLNESPQHTLHIAMVEPTMTEMKMVMCFGFSWRKGHAL
jgi:hypothetical protein